MNKFIEYKGFTLMESLENRKIMILNNNGQLLRECLTIEEAKRRIDNQEV